MSDYEKQLEERIEELEKSIERSYREFEDYKKGNGERVPLSLVVDNWKLVGLYNGMMLNDTEFSSSIVYIIKKECTKFGLFKRKKVTIIREILYNEYINNIIPLDIAGSYSYDVSKEMLKVILTFKIKCIAFGFIERHKDTNTNNIYYRVTKKWVPND